MNLIIDIGNTLQKIAVFNNDESVYGQSFSKITAPILAEIINQYPVKYSIISSVSGKNVKLEALLKAHTQWIPYSHETKIPLKILYNSKETLGLDRIAGAVGAVRLFPQKNVLSIQAGTCLVLDFVNDKSEYLGGSISPGIKMRFDALHEKTKKLPLLTLSENYPNILDESTPQTPHPKPLTPENYPNILGEDTWNSISSGVINGMKYEIEGFIEYYNAKYENLTVILSGGNANYLQKLIKNTIFAAPNLVWIGLNEIIKYNV